MDAVAAPLLLFTFLICAAVLVLWGNPKQYGWQPGVLAILTMPPPALGWLAEGRLAGIAACNTLYPEKR